MGKRLYFVKNAENKVYGPYDTARMKNLADNGKILPSWTVSEDKIEWYKAAKVPGLFRQVDQAIQKSVYQKKQPSSQESQLQKFLDYFVSQNENFENAVYLVKVAKLYWAKLIAPKSFVITEITASGTHYIKHDIDDGLTHEISKEEYEQKVRRRVAPNSKIDKFKVLAACIGIIWAIITLDAGSLLSGFLGTFLCAIILTYGYIIKLEKQKVYVGYSLNHEAIKKLSKLKNCIICLRNSSKVSVFIKGELKSDKRHSWKYHGGETMSIREMPTALFHRKIPNMETNIKVYGIATENRAIYLLPEKVLLLQDGQVRNIKYDEIRTETDYLEYVEQTGQLYSDSTVIEKRWKYINKDGTKDARFKNNIELPVVQCGILDLMVNGESMIQLITTNKSIPEEFSKKLRELT